MRRDLNERILMLIVLFENVEEEDSTREVRERRRKDKNEEREREKREIKFHNNKSTIYDC